MTVSIRIDVDNPFHYFGFVPKVLNYLSINWTNKLDFPALGYLKSANKLCDYLDKNNIQATWFFTIRTLPDKKLLKKLQSAGHEIALHAITANDLISLRKELFQLFQRTYDIIYGFSKHGSGVQKLSRFHDPVYNESHFHYLAKKTGLQYFVGNGEEPTPLHAKNAVSSWDGCFWANPNYRDTDKYTVEWLAKQEDPYVFLIHPTIWKHNRAVNNTLWSLIQHIDEFKLLKDVI